jgi:PhnB protein
MKINPYLSFDGNCEAAFKFYERCFGTKINAMMPYRGSPMADQTSPDWLDRIMHGNMTVGDVILMGSDAPPDRYQKPQGITVAIGITEPAEAERVFAALADGGTVTMPIGETFWALRFGMLVDQFGIPWMVNCERPA